MEQRYGIRIEPNEEAMRKANTALLRDAQARRGQGNGNTAPAGKRPSTGRTGRGRGSHPSDGERLWSRRQLRNAETGFQNTLSILKGRDHHLSKKRIDNAGHTSSQRSFFCAVSRWGASPG